MHRKSTLLHPSPRRKRRVPREPDHRLSVSWPSFLRPLDPSEAAVARGWYGCEQGGRWAIGELVEELSDKLIHAHATVSTSGKEWSGLVFEPKTDVLVTIGPVYPPSSLLRVWARSPVAAESTLRALAQKFLQVSRPYSDPALAEFYVVTIAMGEPQARLITTTARVTTADDLKLHYGEDFLEWHQGLIAQLKSSSNGLTILRGDPGVGKTSYLRALMAELRLSHRFYYLPISSYGLLSNPGSVEFWLQENIRHPQLKRVCVIEDADNLLVHRRSGNHESISNLLNLADGFLGDTLQLQVICSANAAIDQLDPAVVRPGRLLAAREFRRLTRAEAQKLACRRGLTLPRQENYSLAEIYSGAGQDLPDESGTRIGFSAI